MSGSNLYLKRAEGEARNGVAITPATVSARTHAITRMPAYQDAGFLRTSYKDVEDYAQLHVTFTDGTVADLFASELVLGGVHNWIEVVCNNHRTRCNLSPTNGLETFNPTRGNTQGRLLNGEDRHEPRLEQPRH